MKKEINVSSVYCILNKQNEKRYVGSTTNFSHRKSDHLHRLRKGIHYSLDLQRDYNVMGEDSFTLFKLEDVRTFDKAELLAREQYWIDKYKPEYNINPIAGNFTSGARILSAEWHRNHTRVQSQKEKDKRSASLRKFYDEHPNHIVLTDERKKHLSEINTGEKNPNYGLKRSKETLERMAKGRSKKVWNGLVSPDGIVYNGVMNLSKFAKEHNLNEFSLYHVVAGSNKSYKGWTYMDNGNGVSP
jgi:group I intron endonuclease